MGDGPKGIAGLSERQKDVLRLIYALKQVKEIATILGISEHTVKSHIATARQRLGGVSVRQAAIQLHDYEATFGLPSNGGDRNDGMSKPVADLPAFGHGQEISSGRTIPSDQLARAGNGLEDAGSTQQAESGRGNDHHGQALEPDRGAREGDLYLGRRLSVLIGRWVLFARRIKRVKLWQWFGLTLLLAVLLPLVLAVLFEASLSMIRVVQKM